jgi:hypothetical protein
MEAVRDQQRLEGVGQTNGRERDGPLEGQTSITTVKPIRHHFGSRGRICPQERRKVLQRPPSNCTSTALQVARSDEVVLI